MRNHVRSFFMNDNDDIASRTGIFQVIGIRSPLYRDRERNKPLHHDELLATFRVVIMNASLYPLMK